ncbi:MAG: GNAT family N-acetyltransferase [Oscillospiraceae bacterium]|nr:GNAT family N-acetyltransferase [Oscillospiraceae bacterium]
MEIYSNQIDEAIKIMKEVAVWGRNKGFRIWRDEWLTKEELITIDAQPENFYIGKMDGVAVCAFILQWRDSEYWADAKNEAVYLHKLCVRREFAGKNMTRFIIEAIKQLCKKEGIRYIRLDTALDEKIVRKIYLKLGFKIVDIIDYPNGRSMALYELEV